MIKTFGARFLPKHHARPLYTTRIAHFAVPEYCIYFPALLTCPDKVWIDHALHLPLSLGDLLLLSLLFPPRFRSFSKSKVSWLLLLLSVLDVSRDAVAVSCTG